MAAREQGTFCLEHASDVEEMSLRFTSGSRQIAKEGLLMLNSRNIHSIVHHPQFFFSILSRLSFRTGLAR